MALAHVLSSLRQLILDLDTLPSNNDERRVLYRQKFPTLSGPELDDLAKIPPEKLKTYTGSIFAGERDVLQNNFPITFAILKRIWPSVYNQDFNGWDFARALHTVRPWRGNLTRTLSQSFLEHLLLDRRELSKAAPELRDIAILELYSTEIRRDLDSLSPKESLRLIHLVNRSVEEVLTLQYQIPRAVRMYAFKTNPVELRYYFYNHEETLPSSAPLAPSHGVGGRNQDGFTRWTNVSAPVYALLARSPRATPQPLASLAEAAIADAAPGATDEVLFASFLQLLDELIPRGIIVVTDHPANK